jgi:hypothetical protein
MMKISRGTWLAIAAVVAVPTTVAIAKQGDFRGGWRSMSPETRSRLEEGRLAMVKTALQLSPDQEKLWAPVEAQVRERFKTAEARREEWKKKRDERKAERDKGGDKTPDHKRADLAQRFEKMSARMSERADRMKAFTASFSPFYASLSDEQKDVLRPLMRQLAPAFGRPQPHRFAGGWGPGGRERGGWHNHDGHRDHGGPQMRDDNDNDGPEQAPDEPEKKG